ncbi:hypothetical protein I316_03787 [Kwoniella heveanensis BCC8398]|uniref:Uncharacterized protein n=1 Tax=Kwoniella heveanensis BCC8398 TaxID=1296120 RepID=A0A1B9GUM6_9TREE|nr:hypothetical protein I316_03787 [Kwoniella heveanensis BCC8398]
MKLPYSRPWLLEIADRPSCPPTVREGVQNLLTFMWVHRIPPFQGRAPYVGACEVLERILREIEQENADEDEAEGVGMQADGSLSTSTSTPSGTIQDHDNALVEVDDGARSRGRGRGRGGIPGAGVNWNDESKSSSNTNNNSKSKTNGSISYAEIVKEKGPHSPSDRSVGTSNGHSSDNGNGGAAQRTLRPSQEKIRIVDFCSGAGGPLGHIERRINQQRRKEALQPVQFILSDIHPPLSTWKHRYGSQSIYDLNSPPSSSSAGHDSSGSSLASASGLSYIPESIDATSSPPSLSAQRHLRTFFLSFHHFNNELARGVLVDAMRNSEGIAIFELQSCDVGSLVMIAMLGPLSWLITPFTRPSLAILFFTYIIPLIPLILVIDGWISVYRTRSTPHILHLANLASLSLALEGDDEPHWKWEYGSSMHTWPFGRMSWVVGRKSAHADEIETETGAEALGLGGYYEDDEMTDFGSTYGGGGGYENGERHGDEVGSLLSEGGGEVVVNRDEGAILQE